MEKNDNIQITLPENLTNYLTPVVIIVLFAFSWFKFDSEIDKINKKLDSADVKSTTDTATEDTTPKINIDDIKALFDDGSYITFGDGKEDVLLVEVSDPSCPYCAIAAGKNPDLNKMAGAQFTMEKDGGSYIPPVQEFKKLVDDKKAGFVYIYQNGHGNGELAAQALYCAYEDKKFWQAHDLIMSSAGYDLINGTGVENFAGISSEQLSQFLSPVVSPSKMKDCLDSGKYKAMTTRDMATANKLGASGTPGFIINETMFPGAYSYTEMKSLIDEAL